MGSIPSTDRASAGSRGVPRLLLWRPPTSMGERGPNAGISRVLLYRNFDERHLDRAMLSSVTDEFVAEFHDRDMHWRATALVAHLLEGTPSGSHARRSRRAVGTS
jgi:hypothetical protein